MTKFDDIIQSGFSVIPKITSTNLCKPIHGIKYSNFICPCGKWKRSGKKLEYLENEKSFLDEIKNIFHGF